jgi:aspartyl-tRNA(Asn)/glutamyl-tRNA(Gln) amidotransferase subunit A
MAGQLPELIAAMSRVRAHPWLEAAPDTIEAALERLAEPPGEAGSATRTTRCDDLAQIGLAGARQDLGEGRISSGELLDRAIERIDRFDGALNAVLWQDRAGAAEQALAADRRRAAGAPRAALDGLPLAHKDLFGEAGRRQTAGSDFWRAHTAATTATVMTRLAGAGSFSFAGLHMAEFAQNPTGQNASFGDCINPWNAARITGGSSSGSGVAISAGYCLGALGTDTGGSIRLPAACCGVTGLKPTLGRVSRAGVVPLCASLDCVGPLARTALDCAILLDVIAGADPADPTCARLPGPDAEAALDGDLRGQRIGVPVNWFCDVAEPEILAAFAAALQVLRARGAVLLEIAVPLIDEIAVYGGVVARVGASALHAAWMRTQPARYVPHVSARLYPGYAIPATYYVEALQRRPFLLTAFVDAVFGQVDAVATPTLRARAPTRADADVDSGAEGTERTFFAVGDNVRPFNYLGLPAISLPCGFDANGVPIGLQLVGRPFAEARLLRMADAYQREAGPPMLAPL